MFTVLFGIIIYCVKRKYWNNIYLGINERDKFEEWKKKKVVMEAII